MLRVVFYKKNIILVNKLTYLLTGAFLSAKIVKYTLALNYAVFSVIFGELWPLSDDSHIQTNLDTDVRSSPLDRLSKTFDFAYVNLENPYRQSGNTPHNKMTCD